MAFLSDLLGRTITDLDGNLVGKLEDLIARELTEFPHPVIDAVVVKRQGKEQVIPYSAVMSLFARVIPLKCHVEDIPSYDLKEDDIFLSRDVLDKQIIDTDGARVVRVNDLELVRVNGTLYVSNVDLGIMGILRRMGLDHATQAVASGLRLHLPENMISWDNVELLQHDQFMRLRVPADKLNDLHPADLAEILSDLNKLESDQFIESMNVEQVADTLEQVETDFQVRLIENMDDERAADVLEEMEPDEAADLLAELPEERSRRLVSLMDKEEADDVRHLLTFPEDTAGGIMTTDYAIVPPDITAEEAINLLRKEASEIETLIYVYVTDQLDHLLGVFSLTELIFANPKSLVKEFMDDRVKTVHTHDEQDEVAQIVTKYNLLAVPVVDDQNVIHGIVTADDALDKIIPTAWKKRLPRFYH
jgi:CBS domain-containing protein/sporulation protein YlmC with PRC-barrel domain